MKYQLLDDGAAVKDLADGAVAEVLYHFVARREHPRQRLALKVLVSIAAASLLAHALRAELIGKLLRHPDDEEAGLLHHCRPRIVQLQYQYRLHDSLYPRDDQRSLLCKVSGGLHATGARNQFHATQYSLDLTNSFNTILPLLITNNIQRGHGFAQLLYDSESCKHTVRLQHRCVKAVPFALRGLLKTLLRLIPIDVDDEVTCTHGCFSVYLQIKS